MTKNTGKEYEEFVHNVYKAIMAETPGATVSLDEKVTGPDGDRQIDVLIRHRIGTIDFLTVVECRDYATPLSVTQVDGFASKLSDIKASKGIIVTRNGFSRNALGKAERLGIDLVVADRANAIGNSLLNSIPILVHVLQIQNFLIVFRIGESVPKSIKVDTTKPVNGHPLPEIVLRGIELGLMTDPTESPLSKSIPLISKTESHTRKLMLDLVAFFQGEKVYLEDKEGTKHIVTEASLVIEFVEALRFGHSHNLVSAAQVVDQITKKSHLVLDLGEFDNLSDGFIAVTGDLQVPKYANEMLVRATGVKYNPHAVGDVGVSGYDVHGNQKSKITLKKDY